MVRKLQSLIGKSKGFTLIELLIVIAIIAILTVAFLPSALKAPARARDAGNVKLLNDIASAVETYKASTTAYPSTVVAGAVDAPLLAKLGVTLPAGAPTIYYCSTTPAAAGGSYRLGFVPQVTSNVNSGWNIAKFTDLPVNGDCAADLGTPATPLATHMYVLKGPL
ncbi:MAG: prepilin-type N-terminal cleavage/methylation domain-containing protein [Patescibacteria group bacterium]